MATLEEKQELIDTIKGPRYYRIMLWGYGGEAAYMSLTKEAYEFWKPVVEENGDSDLVHYMVSSEDGEYDFEYIDKVPEHADFLKNEYDGETYWSPWYEAPTEFEHTTGVTYDTARITVDELDGEEWGAKVKAGVIDSEELQDLVSRIYDESGDDYLEINEYEVVEEPDADYICQFYSSEKGTFFEGTVETFGPFDPRKLRITTTEFLNGEDTVTMITYDGVEVDNDGGDTNGKGYYASVWKND